MYDSEFCLTLRQRRRSPELVEKIMCVCTVKIPFQRAQSTKIVSEKTDAHCVAMYSLPLFNNRFPYICHLLIHKKRGQATFAMDRSYI